jgi:GDP-L-fucose synthase
MAASRACKLRLQCSAADPAGGGPVAAAWPAAPSAATRIELDLLDAGAVQRWFAEHQPTVVVLAAAKVGSIQANNT